MTGPTRHRTTRTQACATAAAALIPVGCAGPRSMLDPAGPAARGIAQIWWVMFGGAVVVWTLVVVFLLVALLRGHNTRALARPQRLIVGGGLVLPTLLLGSLLVWGTLDSARLTGVGEKPEAVIEVTARQ